MASIKISELEELTSADGSDFIPVVDASANETKKITYRNALNSNIAVLEGNVVASTTQGTAQTSYPLGFNYENCVVVSTMLKATGANATNTWASGTQLNVSDVGTAGFITRVRLESNQVSLSAEYISSFTIRDFPTTYTYKYRIVLMRIS